MDTAKGILLEKKGNLITVLTPEGEFKNFKMADLKAEIGDEIKLPIKDASPNTFALKKWLIAAAAAAVFILLFIPSIITERNVTTQPVAYLSVDINPSVEMELDQNLKVLAVESLNQDADEVTKGLSLKGLTAEEAVSMVTEKAYKKGFLSKEKDNAIFLALTPEKKSMPVSNIEDKIKKSAQKILTKENLGGVVQTVLTTPAIRKEAMAQGLSPGKYAILLEAINSGLNITSEDLRNASIAMAVKSAGGELGELAGKANQEKDIEKLAEKYREKIKAQNKKQQETKGDETTVNNGGQGKTNYNKENHKDGKQNENQKLWPGSKVENRKFEKPSVKSPEYPEEPEGPNKPEMFKENN